MLKSSFLLSIKYKFVSLFFCLLIMTACSDNSNSPLEPDQKRPEAADPFDQNIKLGSGINIGNALEAPKEGDWGITIKEEYFSIIKNAGFNSIRVPIKWSAHALANSPYTIDPVFFERIDWVIDKAFNNGLAIIINIHHYDEIMQDPWGNEERFYSLWEQIADHYQYHSNDLFFEILNEPNAALTTEIWNTFLAKAILKIRVTNPGRTLMVGTANYGGLSGLNALQIPADEKNVIVSYHYYNPFQFTHQGAEWVDGSNAWLGTKWTNSNPERQAIINDFNIAINYGITHNLPINMGEFGAYSKADIESRYLWTIFASQLATLNNISWNYWEFASGFGAYDPTQNKWNEKLLSALIPVM